MEQLLSSREAAGILGFASLRYTRDFLGKPDKIEHSNLGTRYLYLRSHVCEKRKELECRRCEKKKRKGKISCYHCRKACEKCELRSGLCSDCQAKKLVLNFSCHGDCTRCKPDCKMIQALENALKAMKAKVQTV